MATLKCAHCDAPMPDPRSWAEAALSTLIDAPAVPDMATQRRCDKCGRVSAASDLRHTVADRFNAGRLLLWVAAAALFTWAMVQLFLR